MTNNDNNPNQGIDDQQDRNESSGFAAYTGHQVLDDRGERIGEITDVVYDDPTSDVVGDPLVSPKPAWLVVDPGILRAAHYVPVAGSYRSVTGDIVIPWDKEWVKSAPKARGDHLLSRLDMNDLEQHYAAV